MYSIYHFFAHLYRNRNRLEWVPKLEDFPFDIELLSYKGRGKFPDFAIRVNPGGDPSGGELIEAKDSKSYVVPSFNSTIPTGYKSIESLIQGRSSVVREQMEEIGDDIYAVPLREVYYLLRGKDPKTSNTKICLVHGSFFETVNVEELIRKAFGQVLDERLEAEDHAISSELHDLMLRIFSKQDSFSKVRHVENASIKLRFRIMTEVKKEGNVFNSKVYPGIRENTLNFIIPNYPADDIAQRKLYIRQALSASELSEGMNTIITHPFNGDFFVLSYAL
ncbi:MAG: hypothetical protein OXI34_07785 [Chloroflexota bacterium]|nr:hypothetical protein [Chloroflexota bacterium]MDE2947730.1 hypothetical protein [Chloroflexota bacterium]